MTQVVFNICRLDNECYWSNVRDLKRPLGREMQITDRPGLPIRNRSERKEPTS